MPTGGALDLRYVERGAICTVAVGDAELIAYEVLSSITWNQALDHELRHRQWMCDHVPRMRALREAWGDAARARYDEVLALHPFDDAGTKRRERADGLAMRRMCRSEAEAIARDEFPSLIRDEDRRLEP